MSKSQARKLKVGDRVRCTEDSAEGEVVEVGYCAAKVRWDDGAFRNFFFDEPPDWLVFAR